MAADVEIDRMGLFLFTTRNGDAADLKAGGGLSSTLDWPSFYKV
nr:D-lyxose/D-mannose family sugar isomerase [Aurantimonas manganoxydans]